MKTLYRIFRSIVVTAVFTVVGLLLLIFVGLSLPPVQNSIRERAREELAKFLDTKVEIEGVQMTPFNQAVLEDVTVYDRSGRKALQVERVGAGIALWRLIWDRELIFTHAELIGMRASLIQDRRDEPLNIQFIIDAFKPKDKNKPPTKFDFRIRHIVIRRSSVTFDRLWQPHGQRGRMDFNHLNVRDLAADVALPRMRNDDFTIFLHRIKLTEASGFTLEKLSCKVHLTPQILDVQNLQIELPDTRLHPADILVESPEKNWDFINVLAHGRHRFTLEDGRICPADMAAFVPDLSRFNEVFTLDVDVTGNLDDIRIDKFLISNPGATLALKLRGNISGLREHDKFHADIPQLTLNIDGAQTARIVEMLARIKPQAADIMQRLGQLALNAEAKISLSSVETNLQLRSSLGNLDAKGAVGYADRRRISIKGEAHTDGFNIGQLTAQSDLGRIAVDGNCDIMIDNGDVFGSLQADVPFVEYKGKQWTGIVADIQRSAENIDLDLSVNDPDVMLTINGVGQRIGKGGTLTLNAGVQHLDFGSLPLQTPLGYAVVSGQLSADVSGPDLMNLDGEVNLNNLHYDKPGQKSFVLDYLAIRSSEDEKGERLATIHSPYINGELQGQFSIASLPAVMRNMLAPAFPSFITPAPRVAGTDYATLTLNIKHDDWLAEYLKLPVKLLEDVTVNAGFNEVQGTMRADIDIPYMLQGRDKLIRDSHIALNVQRDSHLYNVSVVTTMPSKSNEVTLNLGLDAFNDSTTTHLGWRVHRNGSYRGDINLAALLRKNAISRTPEIDLRVLASTFDINDTTWHIAPAMVKYSDNNLDVEGVRIWSGEQFASISGKASTSDTDTLSIRIKDIDLGYVFSTLGINFVTFGGVATGRFTGTRLFSSSPIAYTDSLFVKGLSYNNGLLGDGLLHSSYDAQAGKVSIRADIHDDGHLAAVVDGSIWVKRDSLSFGLDAHKVNIKFLQPFMQAFTSNVEGRASGNALLYGTFKDIDLRGKIFADTIAMKVDFTNTVYGGSDTVVIHPGNIIIPAFRLYDKNGNTAVLQGWVRHNYFHEPSFEFNITDARRLLCYDTNAGINPIWYGTIYGNGGAQIKGKPGIVSILADMTTAPNSVFTFVLSDTQEAGEYKFLTFTDRRKEAALAAIPDTIPELRRKYMKMVEQQIDQPSAYVMDLRASVTPDAEMILIMDPVAGDKIRAYGSGALQMGYNSDDDRLTMYGRYTLDRGSYNFSLQDLILKTFTIRSGSSISFNGDPYSALLNIDALYRVNTNLTDLDPSFANDRDLNRTNVPVDAVLSVSGDMRQPDIKFDIELPTLTADVARKVKSVVSTDDMMSRQIIYLLALNRFYTPEYMGGSNNNNEFASIASTTLSSHLTNILGQLSPNWSFAPNLRTDQGDFSDLEVDLALSSRLFNNRLLLNGNFGYRDRATSSTTFIGDFDLEYLLNRSGSLRLKAYNHFNDQNYYLKSSLTTQGIGIIYKHDFDRWFTFLRPRRKKKTLLMPASPSSPLKPDTLLHIR